MSGRSAGHRGVEHHDGERESSKNGEERNRFARKSLLDLLRCLVPERRCGDVHHATGRRTKVSIGNVHLTPLYIGECEGAWKHQSLATLV